MSANNYQKSLLRDTSAYVAYEVLTFTDGEYVPTHNSVFTGLYIAPETAAADIEIQGVDGTSQVLSVGAGLWPFGGAKIIEAGTAHTAGDITILF